MATLHRAPGAVASPFGGHASHAVPPRPPAAAAAVSQQHSCSSGLRRAPSGLTRQLSTQCTLPMPQRARSSGRCHAVSQAIELVMQDSSAAMNSFEDVCEALGDIAKLDGLASSAVSSGASGLKAAAAAAVTGGHVHVGLPDPNAALGWGVEKAVGLLAGSSLLQGWVDKSLLDLFQQTFGALELAGGVADSPAVRLGVAVAVALAVRQALAAYRARHPAALARQLSPAASLSDALAESAVGKALLSAAAGLRGSNKQPQQRKQQQQQAVVSRPRMGRQGTLAFAGAGSMCLPVQEEAVEEEEAAAPPRAPPSAASLLGPVALAGSSLLLAQAKRANKMRKQAALVLGEVCQGRWSPAALLVGIEAAALLHSYSELGQGLATLLHLGS